MLSPDSTRISSTPAASVCDDVFPASSSSLTLEEPPPPPVEDEAMETQPTEPEDVANNRYTLPLDHSSYTQHHLQENSTGDLPECPLGLPPSSEVILGPSRDMLTPLNQREQSKHTHSQSRPTFTNLGPIQTVSQPQLASEQNTARGTSLSLSPKAPDIDEGEVIVVVESETACVTMDSQPIYSDDNPVSDVSTVAGVGMSTVAGGGDGIRVVTGESSLAGGGGVKTTVAGNVVGSGEATASTVAAETTVAISGVSTVAGGDDSTVDGSSGIRQAWMAAQALSSTSDCPSSQLSSSQLSSSQLSGGGGSDVSLDTCSLEIEDNSQNKVQEGKTGISVTNTFLLYSIYSLYYRGQCCRVHSTAQ